MNYEDFIKSIKRKDTKIVYIFTGEETYLLDKALEYTINRYVSPDLQAINLSNLDGKTTGLEDLKASCETLPFISEKRIIILRSPDLLVEKEGDAAELLEYLQKLGDHQLLILSDRENRIKKNSKLYRHLNKSESSVVFEKLKGKDLSDWVKRKLEKNGKDMSYTDLNYFLQQSSYSSRNITTTLYDLENELKKLSDFSMEKSISKQTLDQVLIRQLDKNIFDFLTSVSNRDTDRAMEVFNEIYLMNEPVPRILFMISRQFRLLLGYVVYKDKGYGAGEIQEKLKVKPYEFGKISSQGNAMNIRRLREILEDILATDKKLKTTSTDQRLQMEMLIVRLTSR